MLLNLKLYCARHVNLSFISASELVNRRAPDLSQLSPSLLKCMEGQVCSQHYIVVMNLTWWIQIKIPKDLLMSLKFYLFLYWYNTAESTEKLLAIFLHCFYSNFVLSHPKLRNTHSYSDLSPQVSQPWLFQVISKGNTEVFLLSDC